MKKKIKVGIGIILSVLCLSSCENRTYSYTEKDCEKMLEFYSYINEEGFNDSIWDAIKAYFYTTGLDSIYIGEYRRMDLFKNKKVTFHILSFGINAEYDERGDSLKPLNRNGTGVTFIYSGAGPDYHIADPLKILVPSESQEKQLIKFFTKMHFNYLYDKSYRYQKFDDLCGIGYMSGYCYSCDGNKFPKNTYLTCN